MTTMRRIIALDVGDERIGIAMTDGSGIVAQPYATIDRKNQYIAQLVRLIVEFHISEVVIGWPLELSGCVGDQARKVEGFAKKLKAAIRNQLPGEEVVCVFQDERFSTAEAERILIGSGLKNKNRSEALDRVSATLILESYLLKRKSIDT